MAEATKFENIIALANGDTLTGQLQFKLLLTADSAAAKLVLTIGSNTIELQAPQNNSVELSSCVKLGSGVAATIGLTGAGAKAWAIVEID